MSVVSTQKAPAAIGPYSQGRIHGDLLFVSGQLPIDPATGEMPTDAAQQVTQALRNIAAIAEAAGTSLSRTLKTTVLVTDLSQWTALNDAYSAMMSEPYPTRAAYQVAALPRGAQVEIEAVIAL